MSLTRFRLDVPALADPHMRGANVQTLLGAIGAELDARAERVMQGRLASNPFAGGANASRAGAARLADGRLWECEPEALAAIADQRGIRLYDSEPLLSRRYRVSRWWQLHKRRGTHRGTLEHAWPYFMTLGTAMPVIDIVHQAHGAASATWHRIDAAGVYSTSRATPSNFDFDGQSSQWWRWWAFVRLAGTGIAPPNTYGDGHTYGDGERYGVKGLTGEQLVDIASLFLDWKAAHSVCAGVALVWGVSGVPPAGTPVQDATGWWSLPNGKWGSIIDPVTHLGTRPPTVQWIYEP